MNLFFSAIIYPSAYFKWRNDWERAWECGREREREMWMKKTTSGSINKIPKANSDQTNIIFTRVPCTSRPFSFRPEWIFSLNRPCNLDTRALLWQVLNSTASFPHVSLHHISSLSSLSLTCDSPIVQQEEHHFRPYFFKLTFPISRLISRFNIPGI